LAATGLVGCVLLTGGPDAALANDKCTESGGVTTCSGDQSSGIRRDDNGVGEDADNVVVKSLTADIGPNLSSANAEADILFSYGSGASLTSLALQYLESTHKIAVDSVGGTSSYGILFESVPKNGGNGDFESFESGQNGHHGADGRNLDLTLGSGATITGGSASLGGIYALTAGGNGGTGGTST
jgi:hypothetical protein